MSQHKRTRGGSDEECKGAEQAGSISSSVARVDSAAAEAASADEGAPQAIDSSSSRAMGDDPAASAGAASSSASSFSSAAAAPSSASASSSSAVGPSLTSPFESDCAAAEERRRERLEGLRSAAEWMAVLPLVFDQLEAEGLPRVLPELQSLIAQYVEPHRSFIGATRDSSKAVGWRIEPMDGCALHSRLVQVHLDRYRETIAMCARAGCSPPGPPFFGSEADLHAASIEQLLEYISGPSRQHPAYRNYYALPFELLFELGGVDEIIGRFYQSAAVRRLSRLQAAEIEARAQEPFMARQRDLKPFLQMLFESAHEAEFGLPFIDDSSLDLIASYAATPFPPASPLVAVLSPRGFEPLHELWPRGLTLEQLGPIHTGADLTRIVALLSGGRSVQYLLRGGGWDQLIDVSPWLGEEATRRRAQAHESDEEQ